MPNNGTHRAEALLRQRRRLEEMARQAFVSAGEEVDRLRNRLSALRSAEREADDDVRRRLLRDDRADTDDYRRQEPRLRAAADATAARLGDAEREMEHCRERLLDAVKQRRAAELLRDRTMARSRAAAERRGARGREEAYAVRLAIGDAQQSDEEESS